MPKSEQNIYRIARCLARVSKEQAVAELRREVLSV